MPVDRIARPSEAPSGSTISAPPRPADRRGPLLPTDDRAVTSPLSCASPSAASLRGTSRATPCRSRWRQCCATNADALQEDGRGLVVTPLCSGQLGLRRDQLARKRSREDRLGKHVSSAPGGNQAALDGVGHSEKIVDTPNYLGLFGERRHRDRESLQIT